MNTPPSASVPPEPSQAPARRRALLLLNKMARNGGAPIDAALEVLTAGGLDVEEESCDRASALTRTIRERRHDVDCVIVGGGDGTLNCAARAVLETGLPLGILPLGTANDLARTLAIGSDIAVAAQVIADGHLRAIDIGEVNDRLFFNVASIGLAAELARDLTYDVKQRWGRIGYALTTARLLARLRPFTAFLEHDGRIEKVKTVQLAVGNGRHYGGGMTIEQDAVPDDGLFNVYSIGAAQWWRLIVLLPSLRAGTQGNWSDVRAFKASKLTVRTRRPRPINTDGELTSETPAVFRIIPKAIQVYAPRPIKETTA